MALLYECYAGTAQGEQAEPRGISRSLTSSTFVLWHLKPRGTYMLIPRPCCHFSYEAASSVMLKPSEGKAIFEIMDHVCTWDLFYSRLDAQQGLAAPKKDCPIFSHVTSCAMYVISLELIFCQISKLSSAPEQIFVLFARDGWADVAAGKDGGQQWPELWEHACPSDSGFSSDCPPPMLRGMFGLSDAVDLPAWTITVLRQKSFEAEPRTELMGGPSLPQTHLLHDLSLPVFAALGPESGCSAGGSLPGARSPRAAGLCHLCVQERHGLSAGTELPVLGSLSLSFQCLVLASGSLSSSAAETGTSTRACS